MATEHELRLPAERVRAFFLARALDEEDRFGELLAIGDRQEISREIFADGKLEEIDLESAELSRKTRRRLVPLLGERAQKLSAALVARHGDLKPLVSTAPRRGLFLAILILALIVGASSNVLGPERAISVLSPPLFGLILWNFAVFGWLLIQRLVAPFAKAQAGEVRQSWMLKRLMGENGLGKILPHRGAQGRGAEGREERNGAAPASPKVRVVEGHGKAWLGASLPMEAARWTSRLHLAAAAMVAATVLGMYLRGLAFEYRATWESTFLSAPFVDSLLEIILGPALFLLGQELPPVADLQAEKSGPAALWIHTWALTATLFVILPRLALAALAWLRGARLSRSLPFHVSSAYIRRLIASASTSPHEVQVLPYSHRPVEKSMDALRRLMLDFLGARANLRVTPTIVYGGDLPASSAACRVILFTLAQTPEIEVHGEALKELAEELADGQRLLVLVDEAPFLERIPESQRLERRESRRRSWLRNLDVGGIGGGSGPKPIFLAIDESLDTDLALDTLNQGMWPQRPGSQLAGIDG